MLTKSAKKWRLWGTPLKAIFWGHFSYRYAGAKNLPRAKRVRAAIFQKSLDGHARLNMVQQEVHLLADCL